MKITYATIFRCDECGIEHASEDYNADLPDGWIEPGYGMRSFNIKRGDLSIRFSLEDKLFCSIDCFLTHVQEAIEKAIEENEAAIVPKTETEPIAVEG